MAIYFSPKCFMHWFFIGATISRIALLRNCDLCFRIEFFCLPPLPDTYNLRYLRIHRISWGQRAKSHPHSTFLPLKTQIRGQIMPLWMNKSFNESMCMNDRWNGNLLFSEKNGPVRHEASGGHQSIVCRLWCHKKLWFDVETSRCVSDLSALGVKTVYAF